MIEVENLTKYYGKFKALDGIKHRIKENEIFGFLGPNGAGKTMTINLILGKSSQRPLHPFTNSSFNKF